MMGSPAEGQAEYERLKHATGRLLAVMLVLVTGMVCGGLGFVAGAGLF